jgi:hypothetical protein
MECEGLLINLKQKGFQIRPPKDLPKEKIIITILQALSEERIIARNVLRDIIIRSTYAKMKSEGKTGKEAIQVLIEERHTDLNGNDYYLGEDTLRNIIFNKKRKY